VTTWNSSRLSTAYAIPLSAAASSFADKPSTTKLFERLRWLLTDSVLPGTADVSGKSCVLPTLAGATPGASSPMSRNCRPFSGTSRSSVSDTVAATWLLALSSIVAGAETVTLASSAPTASVTGSSNAAPTVSVSWNFASVNPSRCTEIS
jgi:hypothetical protein